MLTLLALSREMTAQTHRQLESDQRFLMIFISYREMARQPPLGFFLFCHQLVRVASRDCFLVAHSELLSRERRPGPDPSGVRDLRLVCLRATLARRPARARDAFDRTRRTDPSVGESSGRKPQANGKWGCPPLYREEGPQQHEFRGVSGLNTSIPRIRGVSGLNTSIRPVRVASPVRRHHTSVSSSPPERKDPSNARSEAYRA